MPAVSVAIPAYKPQFLGEAIKSVLDQDFPDFELLISDDLCDGSIEAVVSRFEDRRIRFLRGPGRGLVANSAFLWDQASADLLKFLYDDDLLYPSALRELQAAINRRSDFAYAFSNRDVIDATGTVVLKPRTFQEEGWLWFEPGKIPNYLVSNIVNKVGEPSNIIIRRSSFRGSECLSEFCGVRVRHLIDVAFYMNAGWAGCSTAVSAYLAAFRLHEAQVSARTKSPSYSIGIFEWELFLRGGVHSGLVEPSAALQGLSKLTSMYARHRDHFPELDIFLQGAPSLRDQLAAGERSVLTDDFRNAMTSADEIIARRAAAVGLSTDSPAP